MLTKEQYEKVITLLGVPCTFKQTKSPAGTTQIEKAGFSTVGKNRGDETLVNALGVNGKVITIKASSLTIVPEKFDVILQSDEKYVIDSVSPVHEPNTGVVIGYRCLVKGK